MAKKRPFVEPTIKMFPPGPAPKSTLTAKPKSSSRSGTLGSISTVPNVGKGGTRGGQQKRRNAYGRGRQDARLLADAQAKAARHDARLPAVLASDKKKLPTVMVDGKAQPVYTKVAVKAQRTMVNGHVVGVRLIAAIPNDAGRAFGNAVTSFNKEYRVMESGDIKTFTPADIKRFKDRLAHQGYVVSEVKGKIPGFGKGGWDESKHPRVPKGSGDPSGEWTSPTNPRVAAAVRKELKAATKAKKAERAALLQPQPATHWDPKLGYIAPRKTPKTFFGPPQQPFQDEKNKLPFVKGKLRVEIRDPFAQRNIAGTREAASIGRAASSKGTGSMGRTGGKR